MSDSDALRALLTRQLDASVARRSYTEILRTIPPAARGVVPDGLPDGYSIWQLVEHMRRSQDDYLDYCRNPDYSFPDWPDAYWPAAAAPPSDAAWREGVARFEEGIEAATALVNDPEIDLAGTIPHSDGEKYHSTRYVDELAAIADHNAYHLGQVVTVRRLLGAWPPEDIEAPEWTADA
jgi:uncharacterized damage-inducible protein DinB